MEDQFQRLAIALAIGLLFGLERGWSQRGLLEGKRAAGLRTFGLSGLLGGVSALVGARSDMALLPVALLTFGAVMAAFQHLEARSSQNFSVTGTVAALLAFMLGAYAVIGDVTVAVAAAAAATAMLAFKQQLHRWLRNLSWQEVRAFVILLVMSVLIAPILPNRPIDPWDALNPYEIWWLAVLLAAISFVGYIAIRLLGDRAGLLVSALAGGMASSTATTLTFAKMVKSNPDMCRPLSGATFISCAVMMARVVVVASVVNPVLTRLLLLPLVVSGGVLGGIGLVLVVVRRKSSVTPPRLELSSPMELGTALKLAALIAAVMLVSKLAATFSGAAGVFGLAAVSGIADVDAITLSLSRLAADTVSNQTAAIGILVAVTMNTLAKSLMAGIVGTPKHGLIIAAGSVGALGAAGVLLVAS